MQIIIALIVLSVLVVIHEFGHFSVAKFFNIKVHEFSLGMGPKIWGKGKGDTQYSIRAFPIGGYVKMEGEDENSKDKRALCNKPAYQRFLVVVAGPVMNFLFAILVFIILLSFLPTIPVPIVESIEIDSPAQIAGILPGDKILKLNNEKINIQRDAVYFFEGNGDKSVEVLLKRDGKKVNLTVEPKLNEEYGRYMIGYVAKTVKPNPVLVIKNGYFETVFLSKAILVSFKDLITGKLGTDQLSGPVGIVNTIGQASQQGMSSLSFLAAFISISFGIFNLLPLPALDGGRIIFLIIEMIRRKPVDSEKEGFVHFIGFALLIALMLFVTYNDIAKLITK